MQTTCLVPTEQRKVSVCINQWCAGHTLNHAQQPRLRVYSVGYLGYPKYLGRYCFHQTPTPTPYFLRISALCSHHSSSCQLCMIAPSRPVVPPRLIKLTCRLVLFLACAPATLDRFGRREYGYNSVLNSWPAKPTNSLLHRAMMHHACLRESGQRKTQLSLFLSLSLLPLSLSLRGPTHWGGQLKSDVVHKYGVPVIAISFHLMGTPTLSSSWVRVTN